MKATSTDPVVIEWAKAQPTAVWAGTPADPLGARRTAVDLEWTVDAYLALGARRVVGCGRTLFTRTGRALCCRPIGHTELCTPEPGPDGCETWTYISRSDREDPSMEEVTS